MNTSLVGAEHVELHAIDGHGLAATGQMTEPGDHQTGHGIDLFVAERLPRGAKRFLVVNKADRMPQARMMAQLAAAETDAAARPAARRRNNLGAGP